MQVQGQHELQGELNSLQISLSPLFTFGTAAKGSQPTQPEPEGSITPQPSFVCGLQDGSKTIQP